MKEIKTDFLVKGLKDGNTYYIVKNNNDRYNIFQTFSESTKHMKLEEVKEVLEHNEVEDEDMPIIWFLISFISICLSLYIYIDINSEFNHKVVDYEETIHQLEPLDIKNLKLKEGSHIYLYEDEENNTYNFKLKNNEDTKLTVNDVSLSNYKSDFDKVTNIKINRLVEIDNDDKNK